MKKSLVQMVAILAVALGAVSSAQAHSGHGNDWGKIAVGAAVGAIVVDSLHHHGKYHHKPVKHKRVYTKVYSKPRYHKKKYHHKKHYHGRRHCPPKRHHVHHVHF